MNRAALFFTLFLTGCCTTDTITVERPAPPPTVVTVTDTVRLASPAPPPRVEVVEDLRVDTLVVTKTVPVEVTVFPDVPSARDRLPAAEVVGLAATDTILVVQTRRTTQRFRLPEAGETLEVSVYGPDSLAARVYGTPADPPDDVVEVRCPDALLKNSLWGWVKLFGGLAFAFVAGWIARSFAA